jgi:hypothetical protein
MTLITNWKEVLKYAYSIWAAGAIILFSAGTQIMPFIEPSLHISQTTSSMITGLLGVAVWILRIVDQHLGITPPNV